MTELTKQWGFEPVFGGLLSPQFVDSMFNDLNKTFEQAYNQKTTYPYDLILIKDGDEYQKFILKFALSGFSKEDIQVKVVNDELKIDVQSKGDPENKTWEFVHNGIAHRSMKTAFKLGTMMDKENISMSYENGLLSIEIPFKQKEQFEVKFK